MPALDFSSQADPVETPPDFSKQAVPVDYGDSGDLPSTGGNATTLTPPTFGKFVGKSLDVAGKVASAYTQDVAENWYAHLHPEETPPAPMRNTEAVIADQPTPYDTETADVKGAAGIAKGVSEGISYTAPKIAAVAATGGGAIPAGLVFGSTPQGFDPKTASVMATFAPISELGGMAGASLAAKLGTTSGTVAKAATMLGSAAASQAWLDVTSLPDYLKMSPDERKDAWIKNFAINAAFHAKDIPDLANTAAGEAAWRMAANEKAKTFQKDFWKTRPIPTVEPSEPGEQPTTQTPNEKPIIDAEEVPPAGNAVPPVSVGQTVGAKGQVAPEEPTSIQQPINPYAIQIRSTAPVSVEPASGHSEEVGGRVPQPEETPDAQVKIPPAPQVAQPNPQVEPLTAVQKIKQQLGINDQEVLELVNAKNLGERRAVLEDALRRVGIQTRGRQAGPHNEAVETGIDEALNDTIENLPLEDAKLELQLKKPSTANPAPTPSVVPSTAQAPAVPVKAPAVGLSLDEQARLSLRAQDEAYRRKLAGQQTPPKESFPQAMSRLGRQKVEELIGDWDSDAQLSPDGKSITTFADPRNRTGKVKASLKDFLSWLTDNETPSTPTETTKAVVGDSQPPKVPASIQSPEERFIAERSTPRKGTPERAKYDAENNAAIEASQAAYEKSERLLADYKAAKYGSVKKDRLSKQHEAASDEYRKLLPASNAARERYQTAGLEDLAEAGIPISSEYAARIAEAKRTRLTPSNPSSRKSNIERARDKDQSAYEIAQQQLVKAYTDRGLTQKEAESEAMNHLSSLSGYPLAEGDKMVQRLDRMAEVVKERREKDELLKQFDAIDSPVQGTQRDRFRSEIGSNYGSVEDSRKALEKYKAWVAEQKSNLAREQEGKDKILNEKKESNTEQLSQQPTMKFSMRDYIGNKLAPGRYATDGRLMVDLEALKPAEAKKFREQPLQHGSPIEQEKAVRQVWTPNVTDAKAVLIKVGYRLGPSKTELVYFVDPKTGRFWAVDRAFEGLIDRGLRGEKTTVKANGANDKNTPVIFYVGEKPVALAMGFAHGEGVDINVPDALKKVGSEPSVEKLEPPPEGGLPVVPAPQIPTEPPPVEAVVPRTGIEALDAKKVKVEVPVGSKFIRGTTKSGSESVQPIENFKSGNPFQGAGIVKVEAGTKDAKGKFVPQKGAVTITDVLPVKKGQLGDGEGPYIEETQATGREAIRQMFDRTDIGIDQKTRDVWEAMLNVPALRDLDWNNLAVKMRQSIEGGLAGAQSPGQIELSANATAQTFPHEVFHILYDALPPEYQQAVNQMRIAELQSRFGNNIPAALASGTMTTDDFLRLGFPKELYPLINPSEYLSNIAGKKFAEEDFKKFSQQPEGFWQKFHAQLQKWVKAIVNTFKRIVRARPDLNSIIDDLLNGRWQTTPETGAEFERRGSLAVSPKGYAKQEAFQERALPERTLGAYGDLSVIKNREADAIDASPEARKQVSIPNQDLMASMASAALATDRFVLDNYAQMKARVAGSDPGLKWSVTQDALHAVENEKARQVRTAGLLAKQEAIVTSPGFIKTVQKMIEKGGQAEDNADAAETFKSQMSQEAAAVIKELDIKGKTEAQYDQLRSDYQRLQKMQEFSAAVVERVNDIINVVAASKGGLDLLYGGEDKTGQKIYNTYIDLKSQTPNPESVGLRGSVDPEFLSAADRALLSESKRPQLSNDQKVFARLASQVLAANTGLRWEMASKAHAMIDPEFKAQLTQVGEKFRKQFEKDPEMAIRQMLKAAQGLTKKAVNAETSWLRMQRKIMPQLRRYDTLKQAVEIDTRTANSPEYKALVNQIYADSGAVAVPSSELEKVSPGNVFNEFSGRQKLRAPSGIEYDINLGYTKKTVQEAQDQMNLYLSDMNSWLDDPANAQSPDRQYWQMRYDFIQNAVNVSNVLSPTSIGSFGAKGAWTMMDFFFKGSSLPAAKLTWTAGNNFFRSYNIADQWYNGTEGEWRTRVINAIKSHGYDPNTETAQYQQKVLNRLAAEYRNGHALVAGQRLNNGVVLTAQDVDLLKYQGRGISILFNANRNLGREGVMGRDLVLDQWAKNVFALRSAQELGAVAGTTLPHEFSSQAVALARRVAQIPQGDINALISLFDTPEIFDEFVQRFLAERKADFSELSPFEDIYRDIAAKWRNGSPDAPTNIGEIITYINSHTTAEHTQDSIRKQVIDEMEQQLRLFNKNFVERESEGTDVRALRATKESAFTKGFQKDVGSSFFYDFGAMTSPDIRSIAVDSTNFHLVRLVNSLDSALKAYDEALAELGTAKDVKAVGKAQRKAFRSGEDFRNFEKLQAERSQLKYFRDRIGEAYGSNQANVVDLFSNLGGLTRDFTGAALTGLNTIGKVAVGSTVKAGLILQAFERNGIASYPKAAWSTLMSTAAIFGRGIKNVPGETLKAWREGGKEGVGYAVARGMQEAFESLFRQGKYFNQQYEYGLGFKQPVGFRVYNEVTTPYSGGMGYDPKLANNFLLRWSQKGFYRFWSTTIRPPLEVIKAMFPQLAYAISYDAVARAGAWSVDGIAAQARRSFEFLEKSGGLTQYDLDNPSSIKNILPVDYILPTGIFEKTQTNLNFARDWWQRAVDLPLNEMVINYWKKLSQTPPERRGDVSFLAADREGAENIKRAEDGRMGALLSILLKDVHHASPENRPMILRVDRTQRFLFPLLGWTTQSIRDTAYRMGSAPSPNMGRMRLLAAAGALGFIAAATLAGEAEKELKKVFAKFMGEEYPVKMLAESQSGKEAAKMLLLDSTSMIPIVHDMLASFMGENGVHSAGTGITVFSVDRLNALLHYVTGAIKTGDWSYGLATLANQEVPFAKFFTSRMESRKGLLARGAVQTMVQKYGPEELKGKETGGYAVPNELSPFKQRLSNAIFSGDTAATQKAMNEFVAQAVAMGKSPEEAQKVLAQAVVSLNPIQMGSSKMTAQQREEFLAKLSPEQLKIEQAAEANYQNAENMVGRSTELTKSEGGSGGFGRVRIGGGFGPSIRSGGGIGGRTRSTGAVNRIRSRGRSTSLSGGVKGIRAPHLTSVSNRVRSKGRNRIRSRRRKVTA